MHDRNGLFPIGNIYAISRIMFPSGNFRVENRPNRALWFPIGNIDRMARRKTEKQKTGTEASAGDYAARFGALVRERREAMNLRQEDIVFTTGIGRRFIIELEAGKPSVQLGKALMVAAAVGLRPLDLMAQDNSDTALLPELPEPAEEPSSG
jgi:hypothetical protein